MRYKSIFWVLSIATLVFFFFSFQVKELETESDIEVETVEDLIALKVKSRVADFKERTLDRCTERIMKRANEMVDSILIARARYTLIIDSIQKPPKPTKPEKPEVPIVEDTTPIKPLLEEY